MQGGSGPEKKLPPQEMTTEERPRLGGERAGLGHRSPVTAPHRHLRNLRDLVMEAAQQEWDELVEEGVAVPQAQQPAPHHARHRLAHLRAGDSQQHPQAGTWAAGPTPQAPQGPGPARCSSSCAVRILGLGQIARMPSLAGLSPCPQAQAGPSLTTAGSVAQSQPCGAFAALCTGTSQASAACV